MPLLAPGDDLEMFRGEVRAWVEANFPPELNGRAPRTGEPDPAGAAYDRWKQALCGRGWGTPTWPSAYGGGGLTTQQARIVREEVRAVGGWNPIGWTMGVRMLGPTLLEFGSEAQKQEHLPGIARGEVRWCQGYSEPNAGSDLAALQTRAVDCGDRFAVTGQKVWTSGAQHADWCFCLVRTDTTRKHEGISFLLIDMRSRGIEVRPIRLISGSSPFCETFFQDVAVPKSNLVGPLNGGWTIGKRLLQYERQRSEDAPARGGDPRPLQVIARDYLGLGVDGRLADADLRRRITEHLMDRRAYLLTMERAAQARASSGPSAATSILKNASAQVGQGRAELLLELMGHQGLGWDGEGFSGDERDAVRDWLAGKATTIFAGSFEIQNNIIAKRILGLPDPT